MNASIHPASDFASCDPVGTCGWIVPGILLVFFFAFTCLNSFASEALGYKTCIRNALLDLERDKLPWLLREQERMNRGWRGELTAAKEVVVEEEAPQISQTPSPEEERPEDALKWEIFTIVNKVMWRLAHEIPATDSARAFEMEIGVMDDCLLDDPVYRYIREKCRMSGKRLEDSREDFRWEYSRFKEMDRERLREKVFHHVRDETTKREQFRGEYWRKDLKLVKK